MSSLQTDLVTCSDEFFTALSQDSSVFSTADEHNKSPAMPSVISIPQTVSELEPPSVHRKSSSTDILGKSSVLLTQKPSDVKNKSHSTSVKRSAKRISETFTSQSNENDVLPSQPFGPLSQELQRHDNSNKNQSPRSKRARISTLQPLTMSNTSDILPYRQPGPSISNSEELSDSGMYNPGVGKSASAQPNNYNSSVQNSSTRHLERVIINNISSTLDTYLTQMNFTDIVLMNFHSELINFLKIFYEKNK